MFLYFTANTSADTYYMSLLFAGYYLYIYGEDLK